MSWMNRCKNAWEVFLYEKRGRFLYRIYDRCADLFYGMETRRHVNPEHYGFAEAHVYAPSDWWAVRKMLSSLSLGHDEVFLDIGCGKGRVLRIASELGFERVVGIELVPMIADQARKNLGRRAEIIVGDARNTPFPEDLTFVFIFNPFPWEVFSVVLNRLHAFAKAKRRPLRVLYHGPVCHDWALAQAYVQDITSFSIDARYWEEFKLYRITPVGA